MNNQIGDVCVAKSVTSDPRQVLSAAASER